MNSELLVVFLDEPVLVHTRTFFLLTCFEITMEQVKKLIFFRSI